MFWETNHLATTFDDIYAWLLSMVYRAVSFKAIIMDTMLMIILIVTVSGK
jgi:hypothetical protein